MNCGSPAVLRLLLRCYADQQDSEKEEQAILLKHGMIEPVPAEVRHEGYPDHQTTPRGDVFVKHLLQIPFPEWAMSGERNTDREMPGIYRPRERPDLWPEARKGAPSQKPVTATGWSMP